MSRWCPKCGAEYREGYGRCSQCDVELVDEQPGPKQSRPRARVSFIEPGGGRSEDQFVSVWEGPTPTGQALVRRLEKALIPVDTGEADEPGRLRLQVPESYIPEALDVLDAADDSPSTSEGEPDGHGRDRAAGWSPAIRIVLLLVAVALVVALLLTRV